MNAVMCYSRLFKVACSFVQFCVRTLPVLQCELLELKTFYAVLLSWLQLSRSFVCCLLSTRLAILAYLLSTASYSHSFVHCHSLAILAACCVVQCFILAALPL